MYRERKTLAEFSRAYLGSFETPSIVNLAPDEGNAGDGFAAHVVLGMKRANVAPGYTDEERALRLHSPA